MTGYTLFVDLPIHGNFDGVGIFVKSELACTVLLDLKLMKPDDCKTDNTIQYNTNLLVMIKTLLKMYGWRSLKIMKLFSLEVSTGIQILMSRCLLNTWIIVSKCFTGARNSV